MKQILIAQNNVYRYNLYGGISDFNTYNEFISDLAGMSSSDAVALYINSPGGRLDVGVSLIHAIVNCAAPVTAIVEAPSYSMASILACACSKLHLCENTFLMFHNYSTLYGGKGGELMSSIHHNDSHFNQLMEDVCYPFLTKKELKKIQKDEDIYIYSSDETLEKRKTRHFQYV